MLIVIIYVFHAFYEVIASVIVLSVEQWLNERISSNH